MANADITQVLELAATGDPSASESLLPLVYDHLRALAAQRLSHEAPGNTLQPTALVHEAYLRIAGARDGEWEGRRHFFAAAALAMRRILVDHARAKNGPMRGGNRDRVPLSRAEDQSPTGEDVDKVDWIMLDDALRALQVHDAELAQVVHLRYFAGLSIDDTAHSLGRSASAVDRDWKVARAWLLREMQRGVRE